MSTAKPVLPSKGAHTIDALLSQIVVDPRDQLGKWSGEREFTQSIKERGVQEEIVVVPLPDLPKVKRGRNWKSRYLLIHGRHRYASALKSGQKTIKIKISNLDPHNRRAHLEYSLVSNYVREGRDPVTLGEDFNKLLDEGASVEEIAELVKKKVGYVYQHLEMLKLIAPIRRAVQWGQITFTQARELLRLDPGGQKEAWAELTALAASYGKEVKDLPVNKVRVVCRALRALDAAAKEKTKAKRVEDPEDNASQETESESKSEPNFSNLYQSYLRAEELGESKKETHAERQIQEPMEALLEIAERLLTIADQSDEGQGESEIRQLARCLYTLIARIEPQLRQSKARVALQTIKANGHTRERVLTPKRSAAGTSI